MTTTVITTYTAANTTGSELSHHTMLDETTPSTPTTGAMRDGFFLWWVVRGGAVIMEAQGPELPWGTVTNGDRVFGQAFDSAGNAGAIASYTYSIDEVWNFTYYIDPTTGSDSDDGYSEGNAKATWAGAWSQHVTDRASGEKARFLLKRGETFAATGIGSASWVVLGAYVGHLKVSTYGSGALPHCDLTTTGNGAAFVGGTLGGCSLTVDSIDIDGQDSDASASCLQMPTDPESGSTEAGLMFLNCNIERVNGVWIGHGPDASTSYAFKNRADFVLIQDCTVDDYSGAANGLPEALFTGYSTLAYGGLVRNTFGLVGGANGFCRGHRWRHVGIINNVWDRSTSAAGGAQSNVLRIGGGGDTDADDCAHHINIYGNQILEAREGIEIEHTNNANQWSWQDIWIHGNYIRLVNDGVGNNPISLAGGGGGSPSYSGRCTRIRIEANATLGVYPCVGITAIDPSTGGGNIESVRIVHNTHIAPYSTNTMICNVSSPGGGASTCIDNGSLTILGNYAWCASTGFTSNMFSLYDYLWIAASDYNHQRQAGGGTAWNNGTSLASWQGTTSLDANSTDGFTASHLLTNVGATTFDPTPTASLFAAGLEGYAGAVLFDYAGNLFDAAEPDAGAVQYGGSAPTGPDPGVATITSTIPGMTLGVVSGSLSAPLATLTSTIPGMTFAEVSGAFSTIPLATITDSLPGMTMAAVTGTLSSYFPQAPTPSAGRRRVRFTRFGF